MAAKKAKKKPAKPKPTTIVEQPSNAAWTPGQDAGDVPAIVRTEEGLDVPAAELQHLHPAIRRFAVRCDSLTQDPDNARLHTERNLRAIANSLRKYGQQPLLVNFDRQTRTIKVGNGRHEVATDPKWGLSWTWIAAVPSNLATAELKAFALADNRTAELAEWDPEVVERQLEELADELADFDAGEIGFDTKELDALMKGDFEDAHGFTPPKQKKPPVEKDEQAIASQFLLIVKCRDEAHQAELIAQFEEQGLDYTAPSS